MSVRDQRHSRLYTNVCFDMIMIMIIECALSVTLKPMCTARAFISDVCVLCAAIQVLALMLLGYGFAAARLIDSSR